MLNSLQIESSFKIEKKTLTLSTLASRRGWRRRKSGLRRRWRRGPGWSAWRRTRTTWHRRLMVDIDLLDKINRTKVAAGPWSGWPLDKLQTPVRWIAGIISSSHTWYLSRAPRACSCNLFLAGVNFYRFNAKNCQFTVYFAVITQKKWQFSV